MLIETEIELPTTVDDAMNLFWDMQEWSKVWSPVTDVSMLYSDDVHQEILMTVDRDGVVEKNRTCRFRFDEQTIEFFSPQPPPMMSYHQGAWLFKNLGKKYCKVKARREFALQRYKGESNAIFSERYLKFSTHFEKRLHTILEKFQSHFSGDVKYV